MRKLHSPLVALVGGIVSAASSALAQQVVISTNPAPICIADGLHEYEMKVSADSTSPLAIHGFQWSVEVPPYITLRSANLPIWNDFYDGFNMLSGFNQVSSNVQGGLIRDNYRIANGSSSYGPINRVGDLGIYRYTVNSNAPLGSASFGIENNVGYTFYITTGSPENLPQIQNTPFTIVAPPQQCYANCDESTTTPALTGNDFMCFINRYVSGNSYANCDGSTTTPALTGNDFMCFINNYAAGCS